MTLDMEMWNQVNLMKLLWNLCNKSDNLWIKWIHAYYVKTDSIMHMLVKEIYSWIIKHMLNPREICQNLQQKNIIGDIFNMKIVYKAIHSETPKVSWRKLFCSNMARPKSNFVMQLACNDRLATKYQLLKFGMVKDNKCVLCPCTETMKHLLFECPKMRSIWQEELDWIHINHAPMD